MLPGVDRPALAATIPTRRSPAVLLDVGASVECRPQHLLQFAVMGSMYARVAFGIDTPRVGAAVDRRGRDQGQRADARGAPAAEGLVALLHRQRRGARRLQRRGRRDRLRRVHRQHRAEGERRAGRSGRGSAARGAVEHDHHARRIAAHQPRACATSGSASTTPNTAARRCSGLAGIAIVGHGRSSAKAVRNAVAMAYRFVRASSSSAWSARSPPRDPGQWQRSPH